MEIEYPKVEVSRARDLWLNHIQKILNYYKGGNKNG